MKRFIFFILLLSQLFCQFAPNIGEISVLGLRVSFQQDDNESTTGDGLFIDSLISETCGNYFLDPPPHNRSYFESQLKAVDNYFRSASKGKFGINISTSSIMPAAESDSYELDTTMAYFNPYGDETLQDKRLAELFQKSILAAYSADADSINFTDYDVVIVFHAGIGQDFALPFLDPTPEDIPSAYIDSDFLLENLEVTGIVTDGGTVTTGIILPETQNHLLFGEADNIFLGVSNPCEYQFGLTGTFALMMGFAIGLPPLWETESGKSGVGIFALMDQGSNNGRGVIPAPPDAWTRIYAGWESAKIVRPTKNVPLIQRDSLENQIVQVDINELEYFLIENRNNWITEGVDIDSLRWRNRLSGGSLPDYVTYLMDSVNIEIDSVTGVITSVPNYDLGLPASGLLIWHIDESKIAEGINDYSVNADREYRGIDLEEADGAQDIGYPDLFMFTNFSSGLRWDMWYADNEGYFFANPGFKDELPSFGPDTYPDTRSNNGSDSYIEINNIANDGKTIKFIVANSLMADGFPDASLNIHFLYDFTGDGKPEIIGGKDTLWWASVESSLSKKYFTEKLSTPFQLVVTAFETSVPRLAVIVENGDSLNIDVYKFDNTLGLQLNWSQSLFGNLPVYYEGYPGDDKIDLLFLDQFITVSKNSVVINDSFYSNSEAKITAIVDKSTDMQTDTLNIEILDDGGLSIAKGQSVVNGLSNYDFKYITAVDLENNGEIEILAVDQEGAIFVINTNFTFESGFPIEIHATSPILARDLFGNENPELVVQVDSSDILIFDWRGKEQYRFANPKGSNLQMLSRYQGRNCVVTQSTIWIFDSTTTTNGNEWSYIHHNPSNSRQFNAKLEYREPNTAKLIDTKRTYNYPNPAKKGSTTIRVFVESAEEIEIKIFDIAGFFVKNIVMDGVVKGEVNEVVWDVSKVESGVYFANVTAKDDDKSESKILKIAVVH